jgi:hypothetical protein
MKDLNDYVTGNDLEASDFNEIPSEIQQAITDSGQTLSSGDLGQLSKAIGSIASDNKAAAILLTPINNKSYFIGGTDGGWFKGVTGAALLTYSDNGGSYCGTQFIPTGGDGTKAWVRVDVDVNILHFGAVAYDTKAEAEAGTDSSTQIQTAWTYGRNNNITINHPQDKFFRTTAILKTQVDGSYAANSIVGNSSTIVKDYAGVGVEVRGGATYQDIDDLFISASSSFDAADFEGSLTANVITPTYTEHGFHVINTRARILGCFSELNRGAGLRIESTSANSNRSRYDVETKNNGMAGTYISGTQDDLSVVTAAISTGAEFGPSFFVENDVYFRGWVLRLYAEGGVAGASAVSSGVVDQVYIGKSSACSLHIYSENLNASVQEIRMGVNTERTIIHSERANKDSDDGTDKSNLWAIGNIVQGIGTTPKIREYLAANVGVDNAKYMDIEYVGASSRVIYRERIRGQGLVDLFALNSTTGNGTGVQPYADSSLLNMVVDGVSVGRFDDNATAGNTRFLVFDANKGSLQRVSIGVADSGGVGYKVLRIPN